MIPVQTTHETAPAEVRVPPVTRQPRIALFGLFGIQNLGNECTLQAMLHNVRQQLPAAELYCTSYVPQDTADRHGLPAVPIAARHAREMSSPAPRKRNTITRLLRIFFVRVPTELADWFRIFRLLRSTDVMLMTGTGMLTDYSTTPLGYPYDIFRWAVAARLAGCKVRFVGIGAGPIYAPLSRWFIKTALARADFRSFRDTFSRARLQKMGMDTSRDPVFPDLAFSLPGELFLRGNNAPVRARPAVGVGVIAHFDPRAMGEQNQQAYYHSYLDKTAEFVAWLIQQGYAVRILHGDILHDTAVRRDLRACLEQRGIRYADAGVVDDDIHSVEDLLVQLASIDLVVSPRYHNLLLALMLNKPAISLSYDPKNDALLEGVGLGRFSQPLDQLNVEELKRQFVAMETRLEASTAPLARKLAEYREMLGHQYNLILDDL